MATRIESMRRLSVRKLALFCVAVSVVFATSSCAVAVDDPYVVPGVPDMSTTSAEPIEDSGNLDSTDDNLPAGIAYDDFGCEQIGVVASTFTEGLYPYESNAEQGNERVCLWGSEPGANMIDGTVLDVAVLITPHPDADDTIFDGVCAAQRSRESALDGLGGCIIAFPDKGMNVQGFARKAQITLLASCDGSTLCTPVLPAVFTEDNAVAILENLNQAFTPPPA